MNKTGKKSIKEKTGTANETRVTVKYPFKYPADIRVNERGVYFSAGRTQNHVHSTSSVENNPNPEKIWSLSIMDGKLKH